VGEKDGYFKLENGLRRDIKKGTCSEMLFERYFLVLGYPKSCKVKLWVKRMDASSWKIGLEGTLRKELALKCLLKSISWC
jgi:hypothetical protein